MFKDLFVNAIHTKRKLRVTFFSKEDGGNLVRNCAPMDYGPSSRAKEKNDRFHLWDYGSDKGKHTLSLPPEQIVNMEVLDDGFSPAEFVTWTPKWIVTRDWGAFS